jgi:hypothetical protein
MPDDLGMNVVDSKAFADVDETRLKALAARAGLPTKPTLDAARDMVERMRETWPKIASDLPLDAAVPLFNYRLKEESWLRLCAF